MGEVAIPAVINTSSPAYGEAVQRLESASHLLVTISLSILAAIIFLLMKLEIKSKKTCYGIAYAVFVLSIVSVFLAIHLGYSAGMSLYAGTGDIVVLSEFLDEQAICVLLSASLLVAMFVITGDANVKP